MPAQRPAGIGERRSGLRGGMGAYPAALPYRTVRPDTVGGIPDSQVGQVAPCSERMCTLLEKLLTKFAWWQRFSQNWLATGGGGVAIAAGVTSVVAAFVVPDGKRAMIQRVGVETTPAAAMPTTAWTLRISGTVHPYLNNLVIPATSTANPLEFPYALEPSQLVELVAFNGAGGPITANCILTGFIVAEDEP